MLVAGVFVLLKRFLQFSLFDFLFLLWSFIFHFFLDSSFSCLSSFSLLNTLLNGLMSNPPLINTEIFFVCGNRSGATETCQFLCLIPLEVSVIIVDHFLGGLATTSCLDPVATVPHGLEVVKSLQIFFFVRIVQLKSIGDTITVVIFCFDHIFVTVLLLFFLILVVKSICLNLSSSEFVECSFILKVVSAGKVEN